MLRTETYAKPGALPQVSPGTLEEDLFRRDFTINAMAVRLQKKNHGELVDIYGGRKDINAGLIRFLHRQSFIDDATRIWRAVRYETRFNFKLENSTENQLRACVPLLRTVGGFRLGHELEQVCKEPEPEQILHRLAVHRALSYIHPDLRPDSWLKTMFRKLREVSKPDLPPPDLYLALLFFRFDTDELARVMKYLRLSKQQQQTISSCRKVDLDSLDPSGTYSILRDWLENFQ